MTADALVQTHADLAYRVALRVVGDAEDAADAAQDALVKIWRHAATAPAGHERAWVARVARNAALDLLRRRSVRPRPLVGDAVADDVSPDPLPDADSEARELRSEIQTALDTLDEPYRSIVVLREIEGLAYAEIADALDLPLNTLKVYLHRARRRLQAALRLAVPDLVP